ncbi:alpha/beta fold hydrolase [Jatrophihabitans sp.]|uniref:alpha/beta fold hydrolase n=1 Tax=Jatrophihabitans sp. TaxID=1932789 RepID=UPI002CD7C840|nr:alpha/beta hydrolase [Jatrophihabitans sp.]
MTLRSTSGIAYDRAGPTGRTPVVLVHAGIADRRMWDPQWPALATDRDVLRLDLRGFGESVRRPAGSLSPVDDLLDTLDSAGIDRCHLVGASFGAGVVVEAALVRPGLARSLFLSAPGGSLIAEATPQLREFFAAERTALAADDLQAAVEANLRWWVDGPHRAPGTVPAAVREKVAAMQRLAFELTASWDEVPEAELDPPALERLGEIGIPTLVLVGAQDIDAIADTAARVSAGVPRARQVEWPDVAHLPSLERPEDFLTLLRQWLAEAEAAG